MSKFLTTILFIVSCGLFYAQTADLRELKKKKDRKEKLFGNSWYTGASYTYSGRSQFTLEAGRTYGGMVTEDVVGLWKTSTLGAGYGVAFGKDENMMQLVNCFYEKTYTIFGARVEYLHDFTNSTDYLRPSAGISFYWLDLYYSYSFNLNHENNFGHAVNLKVKWFFPLPHEL